MLEVETNGQHGHMVLEMATNMREAHKKLRGMGKTMHECYRKCFQRKK